MEFVHGENIEVAIRETGKYKNITRLSDLKLPIVIPTVDMIDGKQYIFTNSEILNGEQVIKDAEIAKAVRASSSFPVLYAPLKYEDHIFIDGGMLNNIPVKEVKQLGADKVLAVNFKGAEDFPKKGLYNIALRSVDIMTAKIAELSIQGCDYLVEPKVGHVKLLAIDKIMECYEQGYQETINKIKEIKNIQIENINN